MKLIDYLKISVDCDFYICENNRHYLITQDDFNRINSYDLEIVLIKPALAIKSNLNQSKLDAEARCSIYLQRKEEEENAIKC